MDGIASEPVDGICLDLGRILGEAFLKEGGHCFFPGHFGSTVKNGISELYIGALEGRCKGLEGLCRIVLHLCKGSGRLVGGHIGGQKGLGGFCDSLVVPAPGKSHGKGSIV